MQDPASPLGSKLFLLPCPPATTYIKTMPKSVTLLDLTFHLENATLPSRLNPNATTFQRLLYLPWRIPPLPTSLSLGMAKPCGCGKWARKEFWGPVTQPQVLAPLRVLSSLSWDRPICRWQHWQVSWPWSPSKAPAAAASCAQSNDQGLP